ncbi:MAG: hypothetical protein ABR542_10645, partial [Desulfonatronovibrio sp.]
MRKFFFQFTRIIVIDLVHPVHYVFRLMIKRIRKTIKRKIKSLTYPITTGLVIFLGSFFRRMSWER